MVQFWKRQERIIRKKHLKSCQEESLTKPKNQAKLGIINN